MTSCAACGLPAPATTASCALCRHPMAECPTSCRMEPVGGAWLWTRDGAAQAVAERHDDGRWVIRDVWSGRQHLALVPVAGRAAMGLLDVRGAVLGVVTQRGIRDARGRRVLALRESSHGLHVLAADGTVVAVGCRDHEVVELLVTDTPHALVFAGALGTELVRLRAVA